ncbi:MAG: CAP domain-containing protein [Anaerolineae bacterium]|nr:CAP domain-containing protein [Anaerolineae bacterium]MDQ7036284.1 CAP domain-containing protein [Anaerolineae bacterium]
MKTKTLLIITIILAFSLPLQAQDIVGDLLGRINNLRSQNGLAPYTLHPALTAAAQNQAQWMVNTGQVSHVQEDGSRPSDRAAAAGYTSQWVSENIYMGGLASVESAWNFWLNSPIHYAGLTSPNYQNIGIASARGDGGQSFVLVFGVPSGATSSTSGTSHTNTANNNDAPAAPPSYIVGVDAVGNIMHELQAGQTLGDVLLTYGYSWDDLSALMALNDLTDADIRSLEIGAIILVPPQSGTYTPTPPSEETTPEATEPAAFTVEGSDISASPENTVTPTLTSGLLMPATFVVLSSTPTRVSPTATPPLTPTATSREVMRISTLPVATAIVDTPINTLEANSQSSSKRLPLWIIAAIALQVAVLGLASFEFFRRHRQ